MNVCFESLLITKYILYLDIERGLSINSQRGYRSDLPRLQRWPHSIN